MVAFSDAPCYNKGMAKQKFPQGAKYFKYKLTKAMVITAIVALLLCGVGIVRGVYYLAKNGIHEVSDALTYPLLIAMCIFCVVLAVSILAKSQYVVTDTSYIMQFGLIKSTYAIKDITSVVYDTSSHKLTVYIGEEFSVLPLCEEWHEAFVQALRDVKASIDYQEVTPEHE